MSVRAWLGSGCSSCALFVTRVREQRREGPRETAALPHSAPLSMHRGYFIIDVNVDVDGELSSLCAGISAVVG